MATVAASWLGVLTGLGCGGGRVLGKSDRSDCYCPNLGPCCGDGNNFSRSSISTWTELFGLGFGGNTSNKGPQPLKLQLHAEFNCVHLLT